MRYYVVPERNDRMGNWEAIAEVLEKTGSYLLSFNVKEPGERPEGKITGREISNLMIRLGIRPNLKGYQYLRTAVRICLEDRGELDGITKRLYPSVAKRHKTSADKVEHAIRHMIGASWSAGDSRLQKEVFGYAWPTKRPTNATFIARIVDYLENMEYAWTDFS